MPGTRTRHSRETSGPRVDQLRERARIPLVRQPQLGLGVVKRREAERRPGKHHQGAAWIGEQPFHKAADGVVVNGR